MNKRTLPPLALLMAAGASLFDPGLALGGEAIPQLADVVVTAPPLPPEGAPLGTETVDVTKPGKARAADTAELLEAVPGAAVVRNGPQTGIVQLRGLGGDRVKVRLDGRPVTPACPNHMDPPLHYASPSGVGSITVMSGATPVSLGGDSIGGTVLVESAPLPFAGQDDTTWFGDAGSTWWGSNDGYGFRGAVGAAGDRTSMEYRGSWQTADDLRAGGGARVRDTGYTTQQHGLRASRRTDIGTWGLETGLLRTRDAGTPALPMDMVDDDGVHVGIDYAGEHGFGWIEARVSYGGIDHRMDNFSLRPLAPMVMPMFSKATSEDIGAAVDVSMPRGRSTFRVGVDTHRSRLDAFQENALNGSQQDTFQDARRTRLGLYSEWQAEWSPRWNTLAGLRSDTVLGDAGAVRRFNPMGSAAPDAAAFNASDRDIVDSNIDLTLSARWTPDERSTWELGFARKNRAPSLLERYLWTPTGASAGLADGRTYIGNLDLDPETSHQFSLTSDWHGELWQVKVTPFYNFVSDYIQGVPIVHNQRDVLQFQNLDRADLYGVDASAHRDLGAQFTLAATLSHVRGRDRDRDDNLYRIAPLRGTFSVDHRWRAWESRVEIRWAAAQDKVAAYNAETRTPGYALLNLRSGYTLRGRWRLVAGVDNLLDERYADHLGGINRVIDSDIAVGERLPGAGRFAYVSLDYEL